MTDLDVMQDNSVGPCKEQFYSFTTVIDVSILACVKNKHTSLLNIVVFPQY